MTGTRLENSGWEPDEQARSFAKSYGLDPDKIWAEFHDYWVAKTGANATKKDWLATWRTWCRKAEGNPKLRLENAPEHLVGKSRSRVVTEVSVGGHIVRYTEILHIESELQRRGKIYEEQWVALKAWQEAGGRSSVKLPPRPKPLPTAEERAAYIEEMKERGLL